MKKEVKKEEDYIAKCDICNQSYENWCGSTPCCGAIAYVVDENGEKTDKFMLFAKFEKDGESKKA